MLPFYKVVVNDNDDDTGISFNSMVDRPAHAKKMVKFSKQNKAIFSVDKGKRTVMGVMISANQPIYRNIPEPSNWVFDAPTIEVIRRKFFKNGFIQNLNSDHSENIIKGVTLVDSFICYNDNDNYPKFPEAFKDQNLQDGTWLACYYVHDDSVLAEIESGKWGGFSVEGIFDIIDVSVKSKFKKVNMSKKKTSIFTMLFGEKTNFSEAVSTDGKILFYDGELAEGSEMTVDLDGNKVIAPAGDYELTLDSGDVKLVTLDDAGLITSIEDFVPTDNTEMRAEVADVFKAILKDVNDRFTAIEKNHNAQVAELKALISTNKFGSNPKNKTESTSMSISEILNLKK